MFLCGYGQTRPNNASAAPTNFTDLLTQDAGSGAASKKSNIATARRALTAASDDPGTFTAQENTDWVSNIVVIHPAGAADPVVPVPAKPSVISRAVMRASNW